jgi:hypothetical protein
MEIMVRDAVYNAAGSIDCEILHPTYGWIPFTASPDDVEQHGREIYDAARQMNPLPYEAPPPPPEPVPRSMTFAQMLIGLVTETWITEAEGEAWLQGVVPTAVSTLIATLPVEQRFAALARATRPTEVLRQDSLVLALGAAEGKTAEEMDDFFRTYAQV